MEVTKNAGRKGEKGIKILCPVPYSYKKKDNNAEDDETETTINSIYFKIGHVFDISQVDGDIPTLAEELKDNPESLNEIIEKVIACSPVPIIYDYNLKKNDGNGYYDLLTKTIALRAGMSSLQAFKTLIHKLLTVLCMIKNILADKQRLKPNIYKSIS